MDHKTLRQLIEHRSVALTIADARDPELRLLAANNPFEAMTDYLESECIGQNCRFLQGGENAVKLNDTDRLHKFFDNPSDNFIRHRLVNFRKDGSAFINLLTMTRLRDVQGKPTFILGSQFDLGQADVEELKSYESRLNEKLNSIGKSDRLEDSIHKGTLFALSDAASAIVSARAKLLEVNELSDSSRAF